MESLAVTVGGSSIYDFTTLSVSDALSFVDKLELHGNQMMIAVPMEMIGVTYYNQICMQFKWADSDTLLDEMADFYIDGDMAPLGRLNYVYQNYIPGVTNDLLAETVITLEEKAAGEDKYVPDHVETEPETESVPETDAETEPATEQETEPEAKGGCKAIAGGMAILAILCLGGASLGKKKH